ncbi:MAG: hypothetical protein AAB370_08310 [Verrucomicrobiota bacterium]
MPTKTTSGRATQHGKTSPNHRQAVAKAQGITRQIERMSKGWSVGKRLRTALVFETWAKHLRATSGPIAQRIGGAR